jgi:hypothetical protein
MRSVPGAKVISILDKPAVDSDSIDRSQATPLSKSASSGIVIKASTSALDSPRDSVFTSRVSGENSGTMSRDVLRSCQTPAINSAAATPTTKVRRRRLDDTIQRMWRPPTCLGFARVPEGPPPFALHNR